MVKLCAKESSVFCCSVIGCYLFYAVAREQTLKDCQIIGDYIY